LKQVLLVVGVLSAGALLAWALIVDRGPASTPAPLVLASDAPADPGTEAGSDEIRELEAELARLKAELASLRSRPSAEPSRESAVTDPPGAAEAIVPNDGRIRDPHWYLDRYVASFQTSDTGSEQYRLVVHAFALELAEPIAALVGDLSQPAALRISLIEMIATPRFQGKAGAIVGTLVSLVRSEDASAGACIRALGVVGDRQSGRALEVFACRIRSKDLRHATFATAVALAEEDADRAILRLLSCIGDDLAQVRLLLSLARGLDADACLELFRGASEEDRAIRLAAAQRIGDFRAAPLRDLTASWHVREPDPEVRQCLEASIEKQGQKPSWSPEQAVGPPDAELAQDDIRSWASQEEDAGAEWLELSYSPALRADGVRIFQGLSGGAIAEVHGFSGGSWSPLWVGRQSEFTPGECWIGFAAISRPLDRVRIVLDTKRSPNWNEIDAVELVGPGGSAWAVGASASSYYGQ